MPAFTRLEYERLLYSLVERYPEVTASTLRLYPNSATTGFVRGGVHFHNGLEPRVFELLDLTDGEIFDYSYSVFRGEERICWYDPQPHAEDPGLALTFPHHRHEPPDIKHNRRPVSCITFHAPNLPTLVADCIELGKDREISKPPSPDRFH